MVPYILMKGEIPADSGEYARRDLIRMHDMVQHCFGDPDDPVVLDAQRELLADIVGRASDLQQSDQARAVLSAYHEVVDYLWFQPADAPLPEVLALEGWENGDGLQRGSTRFCSPVLGHEMFAAVTQLLKPHGLLALLSVRTDNIGQHSDRLQLELRQCISVTPAARWLEGFLGDNSAEARRLSVAQRLMREAQIFGEVTEPVRRQFGYVQRAFVRSTPGVGRALARRESALDDEPGRAHAPQPGRRATDKLVQFVNRHVVERYNAEDAVRAAYDRTQSGLALYDLRGNRLDGGDPYSPRDFGNQLLDVFGRHKSFGGDSLSMDLCNGVLERVYQGGPQDVPLSEAYTQEVTKLASFYTEIIQDVFRLRDGSRVEDVLDIIKLPPPETPLHEDPSLSAESGEVIHLQHVNRSVVVEDGGEDSDSIAQQEAFVVGLRGSLSRRLPLYRRLEDGYRALLGGIRRDAGLPEHATDDDIYAALHNMCLSPYDPLAWCVGSLANALHELRSGASELGAQSRTELGQAVELVRALQDAGSQPNRRDPAGYARRPALLAALRRALSPAEPLVTGPEASKDDT